MTPYYQDDAVTLYHGRAEDLPLCGDVAVTDPPYGFGYYQHDIEATSTVLAELLQRRTAAFFAYPEVLVRWCIAIGREPDEWITWWPNTPKRGPVGPRLARTSEHIAVYGPTHGQRIMRPRAADKWARKVSAGRGLDPEWCRDGDVWTDSADGVLNNSAARLHINQKPLSLMRKLVLFCSDEGDIIVDPYAGSGTTLVAAKELGRKAIGVEIDEAHCETAAKRLTQEVLRLETAK